MTEPAFYASVPRIRLRDPLAELLGAASGGLLDYGYADAVRLTGHSCPTVAGAWALTRRALMALYGEDIPARGEIRVDLAGEAAEGVTGVVGTVLSMLTGAAGLGGFKGLAGQYSRRELLHFGVSLPLDVRFTRCDTGAAVDADADLTPVPAAPEIPALLQRCLQGSATADERAALARCWQERGRRLLIEHADDARVFQVRPVTPGDVTRLPPPRPASPGPAHHKLN